MTTRILLPSYLCAYAHPGVRVQRPLLTTPIQVIDRNFKEEVKLETLHYMNTTVWITQIDFDIEKWSYSKFKNFLLELSSKMKNAPVPDYRKIAMVIFQRPGLEKIFKNPTYFNEIVQQEDPESLPALMEFAKNEQDAFLQEVNQENFEDPIQESKILSSVSKKLLSRYFSYAIAPQFIEEKMKQFFSELKEKMKNPNTPAIEIASFAYLRLVKIHPFEDGNGRVARMLMNLILMHFKFPPVYFYSDKEYTQAVRAGMSDPDSFKVYLAKKIAKFYALINLSKQISPNLSEQFKYIEDMGILTCLNLTVDFTLSSLMNDNELF